MHHINQEVYVYVDFLTSINSYCLVWCAVIFTLQSALMINNYEIMNMHVLIIIISQGYDSAEQNT